MWAIIGWTLLKFVGIILVFVILFTLEGAIKRSDARRGSMQILDIPGASGKGGGDDGGTTKSRVAAGAHDGAAAPARAGRSRGHAGRARRARARPCSCTSPQACPS